MKLILSTLAIITLAGCAGTQYNRSSAAYQRCEYQARSATASISSVVVAVIKESELIDLCMAQSR